MVGDTLDTKYFGTYVEQKDVENLAKEFVGFVKVNTLNGCDAAFLYVNVQGKRKRFDLPSFMKNYDGERVAILGREYDKSVNDKVYHKIVVISAKRIENLKKAS